MKTPLRIHAAVLFAALFVAALCAAGCGGGSNGGTPPGGGGGGTSPLVITTSSLPKAVVGVAYSAKLQASGGKPPYTWGLDANAGNPTLPSGLMLAGDGTISGTATSACSYISYPGFRLQDSGGRVLLYSLEMDCVQPLSFSSTTLVNGNVGLFYSSYFNSLVTGGKWPYTLSLSSGSLPPGMALDTSAWALKGTPTSPGNYTFTLQATDSAPPC
jgi:hypothetical protein